MPYLLPDDTTPTVFKCLTIRIPDDPQWESTFWGNMLQLCRWFNFDRDEAHNGKIVADVWCELIEEAMSCNTITGIRFFENRLQIQFCNGSTWVDVGTLQDFGVRFENGAIQFDLGGTGDYAVSLYKNSYENIYGNGLPLTSDADKICRASWTLARSLCDDFHDLSNLFGVGNKILASLFQSVLELIPPTALADDTIEFATEDLPVTIMNWITNAARDPDTIQKVAQMIYCSLLENFPDNLDNVIDDIPLGIYTPIFDPDTATRTLEWINFSDIATSIYDTLTAKFVAYMVIGFARLQINQLLQFVGMVKPAETIMLGALNTALFFDSRDCDGFPCQTWCYQWDFLVSDGGFTVIPATNSLGLWTAGIGWQNQPWVSVPANRNLNVKFTLPEDIEITSVEMMYVVTDLGDPDSAINISCATANFDTGIGSHTQEVDVSFSGSIIAINSNLVRRGLAVRGLILRGQGDLPEGFTGGEICGF